jgi:tetratricopeptide (TPR) repeat protein
VPNDVDALEASQAAYLQGRDQMDDGDLEVAIASFQRSIDAYRHFKTLELLGECHIRLRNFQAAVVPLAAATALNQQSRAASLLAETFERLAAFDKAREFAKLSLSCAQAGGPALSRLRLQGNRPRYRYSSRWNVHRIRQDGAVD